LAGDINNPQQVASMIIALQRTAKKMPSSPDAKKEQQKNQRSGSNRPLFDYKSSTPPVRISHQMFQHVAKIKGNIRAYAPKISWT
jgi:hypothetical protein